MSLSASTYLPVVSSIFYFFLSVGVFLVASNTAHKFLLLPFILIPAILSFTRANYWPGDIGSLWGLLLGIWIAHSISLLWLEDHSVWDDTKPFQSRWVPIRYHKPLKLWNNPRLVGTSRQALRKSSAPLSLRKFVMIRFSKLLVYLAANIFVLPHIFPALFRNMQVDDFGPAKQVFLRRLFSTTEPITMREVMMRAVFVFYWTFGAVTQLDAAHTALSIISVVIFQFNDPADWPGIFGSPRDCWSIRRFWGQFWHQIVVRSYTNYGTFLSRRVLGLRPGSQGDKILVIFIIFLFSGVLHSVVSWQLGDHSWSGDIWWFCLNFAAGALEMAVSRVQRAMGSTRKVCPQGSLTRQKGIAWNKMFGFAWVFFFLFWSLPKSQYPKIYDRVQDILSSMTISEMEN
ncbi:hypothetical protein N7481_009509 [Penicillium waksmanii]|uniref:uncharacterized protein n=1 Tax=Penicillium waksmanii TaxID=69791 RepID=UPI002548170C|nr:uncharacterized protein N7481_009509 [Penicillium waksmanii]KAJ5975802.1 hypothetical protein N7481_009509 [Penicillium waksmanii]